MHMVLVADKNSNKWCSKYNPVML
uniref:Uncharacterized protein n=1 Tax=Arundo donax TaxID=35708 RepID=A0A0A9A266_ARUDO